MFSFHMERNVLNLFYQYFLLSSILNISKIFYMLFQGHSANYSGKSLFWQQFLLACKFPEQSKHAFFKMFSFSVNYAKYIDTCDCINV